MMGIETSGEEADQLFATVDTNRFVMIMVLMIMMTMMIMMIIMIMMTIMIIIMMAIIIPILLQGWENRFAGVH